MFISNQDLPHTDALEKFLQLSQVKTYPAKCNIIRPGDIGDRLYYIMSGSVSVSYKRDDGPDLVLAYLNKGDFIGEIGVFKPVEVRAVSVDTRTRCQLAEFAYADLKPALQNQMKDCAVDFLFMVAEQISSRLLRTNRRYSDLAFLDVEGRIARILLDLCAEPDAMSHPDGVQLYISRQEISRIAGCSREMAGRVLKELEEKKLIHAHGKTIVVHKNHLTTIASTNKASSQANLSI